MFRFRRLHQNGQHETLIREAELGYVDPSLPTKKREGGSLQGTGQKLMGFGEGEESEEVLRAD